LKAFSNVQNVNRIIHRFQPGKYSQNHSFHSIFPFQGVNVNQSSLNARQVLPALRANLVKMVSLVKLVPQERITLMYIHKRLALPLTPPNAFNARRVHPALKAELGMRVL
jgi:hypothetical protein